jgi:MFS family permease
MAALTLAVAIDTQKPFTFTFILPGVTAEYGLRSPSHPAPGHWPVALLPFFGILGTVLGSLIWGRLGDSIGRRASILLAAALFIGTAMCSAMPAFHWNLVACFVMGLGAAACCRSRTRSSRRRSPPGTAARPSCSSRVSGRRSASCSRAGRRTGSFRPTAGGSCGSSACRPGSR